MSSPTPSLSITLSLDLFATLSPTVNGPTRIGVGTTSNVITLGWNFTQDLNFTIVSQSAIPSQIWTIRVITRNAQQDCSWTMLVRATGGFSSIIYSASAGSNQFFMLPPSASFGRADMTITPASGATIVPPSLTPSIYLGTRGLVSSYSFTVKAEDGMTSSSFTLQLGISPNSDNSWSARIYGGGLSGVTYVNSSASVTVVSMNSTTLAPITLDSSSLTYWMNGQTPFSAHAPTVSF
jgi:hypothetical protein